MIFVYLFLVLGNFISYLALPKSDRMIHFRILILTCGCMRVSLSLTTLLICQLVIWYIPSENPKMKAFLGVVLVALSVSCVIGKSVVFKDCGEYQVKSTHALSLCWHCHLKKCFNFRSIMQYFTKYFIFQKMMNHHCSLSY